MQLQGLAVLRQDSGAKDAEKFIFLNQLTCVSGPNGAMNQRLQIKKIPQDILNIKSEAWQLQGLAALRGDSGVKAQIKCKGGRKV